MTTTLACDALVYRLGTSTTLTAANGTISAWSTTTGDAGHLSGAAPANLHEITTIRGDLTLSLQHDDEEVNLKGRRTKAHVPTLEDCQVQFNIIHDPTDPHWQALHKAKVDRSTVPLLFLSNDKATVGAEGVYADFCILDFSREEVINGINMNTVTVGYGLTAVQPQKVIVSA